MIAKNLRSQLSSISRYSHSAAALPSRTASQQKSDKSFATIAAVGATSLVSVGVFLSSWTSACDAEQQQQQQGGVSQGGDVLVNFSGTHQCQPRQLLYPESIEQLEQIIADANNSGKKIRVVGSGLSPNGIGFSDETVVSLALCDRVLHIDPHKQQVTVQAGATVAKVLEALRPHGLTLQNLASINEQQLGGFIQVSAHGTGMTIGPVDEQVVSMRILSPAVGSLVLSESSNPSLFHFAKVGLGSLGIVTEVTLQCVPAHQLNEHTFVQTVEQTRSRHKELLSAYRHLRYMWIPWTDSVVVVGSNPYHPNQHTTSPSSTSETSTATAAATSTTTVSQLAHALEPMKHVYASQRERIAKEAGFKRREDLEAEATGDGQSESVAGWRDRILALDPTNLELVKALNAAEAETWRRLQGERVANSEKVLAFDCGGQQWVWESCFKTPYNNNSSNNSNQTTEQSLTDIDFVVDALKLIEKENIPAHSPIEQRWSSASHAPMSPAYSKDKNDVFSWVGIIMYIPTHDPKMRKEISDRFSNYQRSLLPALEKVRGTVHWAKLEVPESSNDKQQLREYLRSIYDVDQFNHYRKLLDPKNILANLWVDELFPREK